MIKKKILSIFVFLFLTSCGFTPIYLNNNTNFSIEQVDFTGDRQLNNFLKINLNRFKNKESNNKINIKVRSEYEKIILSKDSTGEASNYQIEAKVIFFISQSNTKIQITEKKIMESMSDKFEEVKYEKSIKQNFADSITNKLALELSKN
jgi:hypothetical protein